MEFVSLLILLPMFLSGQPLPPKESSYVSTVPHVAVLENQGLVILPPEDRSLAMTVWQYPSPTKGRGPASVAAVGQRRIDVVVEAP